MAAAPTWDQDAEPQTAIEPNPYVDIEDLDDGRCKASSYQQVRRTAKPRYENWFGPGGFNRCIGDEGHRNPQHKDEFGWVFVQAEPGGSVRTIRHEAPTTKEN